MLDDSIFCTISVLRLGVIVRGYMYVYIHLFLCIYIYIYILHLLGYFWYSHIHNNGCQHRTNVLHYRL